jgi:LacI family transcriptional regulator
MKLTISDIARKAGVSKTTVSRVLNHRPDVDEETRKKILKIIEEFNYSPSYSAKSLSTGKRNLIGLIVPSLSSFFSLEIIRGVAEGISDTQYELVLYTTGLSKYNEQIYMRAIRNDLVDGIIVVLPRDQKESYLRSIHEIPIIAVDYSGIDIQYPRITATNAMGAYEGTKYLIDLGHKRIGFITGLMDLGCSQDRLQGFIQAMDEADYDIDKSHIGSGSFTRASGELLAKEWLSRNEKPTAIFASNDEMALGVMDVAETLGINIPSELSVLGFDDINEARLRRPGLTTIKQPLFEMGNQAAIGIIDLLDGREIQSKVLETQLVIRESCAPPNF